MVKMLKKQGKRLPSFEMLDNKWVVYLRVYLTIYDEMSEGLFRRKFFRFFFPFFCSIHMLFLFFVYDEAAASKITRSFFHSPIYTYIHLLLLFLSHFMFSSPLLDFSFLLLLHDAASSIVKHTHTFLLCPYIRQRQYNYGVTMFGMENTPAGKLKMWQC